MSEQEVTPESVGGFTQVFTHDNTQEKIHKDGELQIQEKLEEMNEQSATKETILSTLRFQYKQNPILTAMTCIAILAICLLSFSGGWVLFGSLAK
ncbi:MAG: hypothetical protein MUW51_11200 [Lactococcus lactis]|nr:hypothetical protein [Lactococcus lactis]